MPLELLGQHVQTGVLGAALPRPLGCVAVKLLQGRLYGAKEAVQGHWKTALEGTFPAVGEVLRDGTEELFVEVARARGAGEDTIPPASGLVCRPKQTTRRSVGSPLRRRR